MVTVAMANSRTDPSTVIYRGCERCLASSDIRQYISELMNGVRGRSTISKTVAACIALCLLLFGQIACPTALCSPEGGADGADDNSKDIGYFSFTWRDNLALASAIGSIATLVALVFSIRQLSRTATATEEAGHALDATRGTFRQHALNGAHRCIVEIELLVSRAEWNLVASKLGDLSDRVHLVGCASDDEDEWQGTCADILQFQHSFQQIASDKQKYTAERERKWQSFRTELTTKIQKGYKPFIKSTTEHDSK